METQTGVSKSQIKGGNKSNIGGNKSMLDIIKEEENQSEFDHKSDSRSQITHLTKQTSVTLTPQEKLEIKQRMITFKLKIFDKLDLRKIMNYWIEKRQTLKIKKSERSIVRKEEKKVHKEEKVTEQREGNNVKYEFKKPDNNLMKIIPFCNNIFSIQKIDS